VLLAVGSANLAAEREGLENRGGEYRLVRTHVLSCIRVPICSEKIVRSEQGESHLYSDENTDVDKIQW